MRFRLHCTSVLILAALFASCCDLFAEETESKIVFLRLRLKDGQISVVDTKIRPGTLKQPRIEAPGRNKLQFETLGPDGKRLSQNVTDDPSMQRMEYFDPETKRFKTIWTKVDDAEFTIRVPWHANLKQVQFYRLSTGKAGDPGAPQTLMRENVNTVQITLPQTEAK